jgi:hypothetical protein
VESAPPRLEVPAIACSRFGVAPVVDQRLALAGAAQAAGFDMKIHPHMLRHACGYKLANEGVDTRTIQTAPNIEAAAVTVTPPVWPASVRGPFFPLWQPLPCFQKRQARIVPAPIDRRDKSPIARA